MINRGTNDVMQNWHFLITNYYCRLKLTTTADRVAQLEEHLTAMREIAGSKPRPDQHSGSLNNLYNDTYKKDYKLNAPSLASSVLHG